MQAVKLSTRKDFMRYYFAPMEGLTDGIFRKLHHQFFPGIDRYYTPFFSPTVHRHLTNREERELPMADSVDFEVVPQLLTKNAEDFLWMAREIRDRGYREVNLNLGCPSGTVVAKGKGSGMLASPDVLDEFLEAIFGQAPLPISIKTRIGVQSPEEFSKILEIYCRYPLAELIIHPRVRKEFYNGSLHMDCFRRALETAPFPVCFNGNLCSAAQIQAFHDAYPAVPAVMLGRGLIGDPGMLTPGGTDTGTLAAFHDALLSEYLTAFGGSRNAMFRLKENWRYLLCRFRGSEQYAKELRKATDLTAYRSITARIFALPLRDQLEPDW